MHKASFVNIDFSQIDNEDLEFLTADLLRSKGFTIESATSRGPDQGKDLLAIRNRTDDIGYVETEKLMVECKHFYKSGKSVREIDIGNFETKMKQHNANRYLLVTTSNISETVKNQLLAVTKDQSSPRKATYWAKHDLNEMLEYNQGIYEKHFHSWSAEAKEAVEYVNNHLFPAHRGALLWCPGVTVVFGNDGYESDKCKAQITHIRKCISGFPYEELAFATDTGKYSWVLLIASPEAYELHKLVWQSFLKFSGVKPDQIAYEHEYNEASNRLYSYFDIPHKPLAPATSLGGTPRKK